MDISDYGIRGIYLAYDLLDGRHDVLVMVDALPLDEPAGTLAWLQVNLDDPGWTLRPADVPPRRDGHRRAGKWQSRRGLRRMHETALCEQILPARRAGGHPVDPEVAGTAAGPDRVREKRVRPPERPLGLGGPA